MCPPGPGLSRPQPPPEGLFLRSPGASLEAPVVREALYGAVLDRGAQDLLIVSHSPCEYLAVPGDLRPSVGGPIPFSLVQRVESGMLPAYDADRNAFGALL